jgi:hypothetical protein
MGISYPSVIVLREYTPSENVNPNQPIQKGSLERGMNTRAKSSQASPNHHSNKAMKKPTIYKF